MGWAVIRGSLMELICLFRKRRLGLERRSRISGSPTGPVSVKEVRAALPADPDKRSLGAGVPPRPMTS